MKQPEAEAIASGRKRIEHRTRRIAVGPMLVVADGAAVCIVDVTRVTENAGTVRWHLARPRRVMPFAVRTFGWFVHVPDRKITERRSATQKVPRATGPYTFRDAGDRRIRGASAKTPEAARRLARKLADERGDWVWIERDGFVTSGEWHAARRAESA